MTKYTDIPKCLLTALIFEGNSVHAEKEYLGGNDYIYSVFSYSTLIYSYDTRQNKSYFDNRFYSVTTSKIQNILISVFNLNQGKQKRTGDVFESGKIINLHFEGVN